MTADLESIVFARQSQGQFGQRNFNDMVPSRRLCSSPAGESSPHGSSKRSIGEEHV
jgi:hypothetical protein